MHGGLDNSWNHSSTRFYVPSSRSLKSLCSDTGPSPRGYHTALYVPKDVANQTRRISSSCSSSCVLTFGGQCCVGGPYQFMNDVWRLELKELTWSRVECRGTLPEPRCV